MGTHAGKAARPVRAGRRRQRLPQGHRRVPAGLVVHIDRHGNQPLQGLCVEGQHPGQQRCPLAVQSLAGFRQLLVPGRQPAQPAAVPQDRIALAQGPAVPLKGGQIARFHVEQRPVHQPPAQIGAIREDPLAVGADHRQRQLTRQLRGAAHPFAADADAQTLRAFLHANRGAGTVVALEYTARHQRGLAPPDELAQTPRAEGTAAAEDMNGLQETGLAAAVGADENVQAGTRRALELGQNPDVLHLDRA